MRIAVLGSGPSGLVAAHAARSERAHVTLYSRDGKSQLFGAQYLHQPIPYVDCGDPKVIRYVMQGTPESYLRKVYRDKWDGTINDEMRAQAHVAWDIRKAYDYLWEIYAEMVNPVIVAPGDGGASVLAAIYADNDLVINTIPRPVLCTKRPDHEFKFTGIYAMGDSDEGACPFKAPEGQIIYNGDAEPGWYRASTINGYSTMEWPLGKLPPFDGVATVHKPLGHSCDCWAESMPRMHHLGRMGRWQNGALVHHVFADTVELIQIAAEDGSQRIAELRKKDVTWLRAKYEDITGHVADLHWHKEALIQKIFVAESDWRLKERLSVAAMETAPSSGTPPYKVVAGRYTGEVDEVREVQPQKVPAPVFADSPRAKILRALYPEDEHVRPVGSQVASWVIESGIPEWLEEFLNKNRDYGDQHALYGLGPAAEFNGLWRKMWKLKRVMWDEEEMTGEGAEEMVNDIIATCFLIKHLWAIESGETAQPRA